MSKEEDKNFQLSGNEFMIRRFDPLIDSPAELTDLLHRSYKILAEMGLKFVATYQDEAETKRRIENGECYVIEADGKVIATITVYFNRSKSQCDWYRNEGVCYFGQFAVEPDYQKKGIGSALMNFAEELALQRGAKEIALDTSEKAEHLISYYNKRGYRFVQHHQWDRVNYRSVVMSRTLREETKQIYGNHEKT